VLPLAMGASMTTWSPSFQALAVWTIERSALEPADILGPAAARDDA